MHGDEDSSFHFDECAYGFFWVHVDVATAGCIVGTDRHESDVGCVMFADFFEAIEVGTVTAVEDFALAGVDYVAAVVAVGIVEVAGSPMVARSVGDVEVIEADDVPNGHFVDGVEAEAFDE